MFKKIVSIFLLIATTWVGIANSSFINTDNTENSSLTQSKIDISKFHFDTEPKIDNWDGITPDIIQEYVFMTAEQFTISNDFINFINFLLTNTNEFSISGNDFSIPDLGLSKEYKININSLDINKNYTGTLSLNIELDNFMSKKIDISLLQSIINQDFSKGIDFAHSQKWSGNICNSLDMLLSNYEIKILNVQNIFSYLFKNKLLDISKNSISYLSNDFIDTSDYILKVLPNSVYSGILKINKISSPNIKMVNFNDFSFLSNKVLSIKNNSEKITDISKTQLYQEMDKTIVENKIYVGNFNNFVLKYNNYIDFFYKIVDDKNFTCRYIVTLKPIISLDSPFITNEFQNINFSFNINYLPSDIIFPTNNSADLGNNVWSAGILGKINQSFNSDGFQSVLNIKEKFSSINFIKQNFKSLRIYFNTKSIGPENESWLLPGFKNGENYWEIPVDSFFADENIHYCQVANYYKNTNKYEAKSIIGFSISWNDNSDIIINSSKSIYFKNKTLFSVNISDGLNFENMELF